MPPITRLSIFITLAAVALLLPLASYAGPPYVTDDPEPVEYQHWELYLATQQFHSADGWSGDAPHLELNYGVIPDVQLHLIAPLAYSRPPGDTFHYGYGVTELGVKYRFIHETDTIPMVGIFPLVEVPSTNRAEGLSNAKTQVFVPIWLQKSFGPWTTYGGGGYWFNPGPDNHNYWYAGWLVQRKITAAFAPGAEIQFRSSQAVGEGPSTALNAGATWDLNETFHVLFSAGHTIQGRSEFQGYFALQLTWGPGKEKEAGKDKK